MLNRKSFVLIVGIVLLFSSSTVASNFNLGVGNNNLKVTNFSFKQQDYILLDVGYGVDKYTGYGLEVLTGAKQGLLGLEYQFLPHQLRNKRKLNYALKLGLVSGTVFNESARSFKAGFIVEKELEMKDIYFNFDVIASSEPVIDAEVGISGKIANGILGVLGGKVITKQDESSSSINYGIKMEF
ncbi:hypothetical protein Halha_1025 [Halobacteroides halobius DSM 5150]|uniref:Outer membrane protein beta-barrel domain-containing protein n=1 Tax=Halobacteroides halobius (strain ATCC 35273 / DSM 5150 / MD-1) TaxID=748449 RepID=L0K7J6_HALHC|nr:hypothetical protein [Halobacteroides halobius]AGB40986.1 hypothetical protein Halha_1025 [Halobacteroides halobius DSM 5150]